MLLPGSKKIIPDRALLEGRYIPSISPPAQGAYRPGLATNTRLVSKEPHSTAIFEFLTFGISELGNNCPTKFI
jgi:hypothetical protein